ncbi:unknown_gene_13149 [Phodopus roborovskii]|uniref:Unknown_gene_13149 protein n=1 Tax=Phodopus roborovskii TaxID=109678 RepID=A0AAU9YMZ2_PHORO|nr:unknown_gene_13149 [Phodopus roborovskii]
MGNSGGYPFNGTRHWLGKLFLGAVFLSTAFQNAAVDCKKMNTNELPSPDLNSSVNSVRMGQNVSLSCSSKNSSMNITYSLFLGKKHLQTKKTRAEAVTFYLKISNTNETGPYKCKTNVSNLQKYSPELNFTISGGRQKTQTNGSQVAPALVKETGSEKLRERSPRVLELHPRKASCMQTSVKLKQRPDHPRSYTMPLQSSRKWHPGDKRVVWVITLITSILNWRTEV